jgi:hypothetical protein
MRALLYYSTFDESIDILREFCAQGLRIVAQPAPLDEPNAPTFDQVTDELVELVKIAPGFYLAGAFTTYPIQYNRVDKGPLTGKYLVSPMEQGPLLNGSVARINVVEGRPRLLHGRAAYGRQYKNPETGEWEAVSPELKSAFKKVIATIKKRVIAYESGVEIFISPAALAQLQSGAATIDEPRLILPAQSQ